MMPRLEQARPGARARWQGAAAAAPRALASVAPAATLLRPQPQHGCYRMHVQLHNTSRGTIPGEYSLFSCCDVSYITCTGRDHL